MPQQLFKNVLDLPTMTGLAPAQNTQEIPQVYDPQAIQREALQAPRIDPIMTAANVATGGLPIGADPGRMFGSILKDILFQHVMSAVGEHVRNVPAEVVAKPSGYKEGYYPPSKYVQPRTLTNFRDTERLPSARYSGAGKTHRMLGPNPDELRGEIGDEDFPDYLRIGKEYAGPEFLKNIAPYGPEGPPDPKELLWHALGLEHSTIPSTVARDIQKEGLTMGWFSEHPGAHFGPIRLGAKPEDLPPMQPRARFLQVDPITELVPDWDPQGRLGRPTVKRRPTPPISIHPSKFTVIDSEGNLLGRLAEQRAGEKATTSLSKQLFKQILEETE